MDGRIVQRVCLHPDAHQQEPELATGFPVEEIYAAYGGRQQVENACGPCVANVPLKSGSDSGGRSLAGCFGWLAFGPNAGASDFQRLMRCNNSDEGSTSCQNHGIVEQFEQAIELAESRDQLKDHFAVSSPAWYGVWSRRTFGAEQLKWLESVCRQVDCQQIDWMRLVKAIEICAEHDLKLHVDLLPIGNSDGVFWTVQASCSDCGVSLASDTQVPCPVCHSKRTTNRSRKMRVLGLRPYLNLGSVIGIEATRQLLAGRSSDDDLR
jgi:Zn finger protein HypA/HybF involved in hydrogenase expression